MPSDRAAWLAELRRTHRPETILTLLQLQALGPGLYTTQDLVELLGVQSSSTSLSLARLKCSGLVQYEGWCKKGRLIWWIADWDGIRPAADRFPRWVLRANAASEVEILFGREKEAAKGLNVHWKTMSNFLSRRYSSHRLLGRWEIKHDPVSYIKRNDAHA
jgi:hypothetical protein